MSQLNLFTPAQPVVERRPTDPAFARKHLNRLLREAKAAERMPWSPPDTRQWRTLFPQLAQVLPAEEAQELCAAFEAELSRLEAAKAA